MTEGGKKDAKYIALEMLKVVHRIDKLAKNRITAIVFDGASNVQKAGHIMRMHCPSASVEHGAEHVVALIVEKLLCLSAIREYSKFCKVVSSFAFVGYHL
jgi:hypothetical protein